MVMVVVVWSAAVNQILGAFHDDHPAKGNARDACVLFVTFCGN